MLAPSIRSGNIPPPPGFHSTAADRENKIGRTFGDSDSIASEDTLASSRITVKGLTNLASYPNPMQKAAQNKLARARAANLTNSRAGTPSSLSVASDLGRDRVTSGGSTVFGTPQPLTAGPPGQRQFRPSTIEGVTRALGTGQENLDATLRAELEWPKLGSTTVDLSSSSDEQPEQLVPPAFNKPANTTDPFPLGQRVSYFGNRASVPSLPLSRAVYDDNSRSATMTPFVGEDTEDTGRHPRDTIPRDAARHYFPHGFPVNYSGRCNPIAENWCDEYPQQRDHSARQSYQTVSEQQAKLNRGFYAGIEAFTKDIHHVAHEHDNRSLKNKIGVIGEGRERVGTSHRDRTDNNGRPQLVTLSVEESNRIPSHAHAEPLLSMAFATLLRCKEEISSRKCAGGAESNSILKPDQTWIDDSSEGNKSFYEAQKVVEQPKKRRTIKRARRGY